MIFNKITKEVLFLGGTNIILVGSLAWGKYTEDHIKNSVHAPNSYRESVTKFLEIVSNLTEKLLAS